MNLLTIELEYNLYNIDRELFTQATKSIVYCNQVIIKTLFF